MIIQNPRLIPKLLPLTPYEIVLLQIQGTFDAIRYGRQGMDYIPPHMGGLFGQREVMDEIVVLEITNFEVK